MPRYALIENSKVKSIFDADEGIESCIHPSIHLEKVGIEVQEGFIFEGGNFTPPPPSVEIDKTLLIIEATSNPVSGSDRFLLESLYLQAQGFAVNSIEVKELRNKALERRSEIISSFAEI